MIAAIAGRGDFLAAKPRAGATSGEHGAGDDYRDDLEHRKDSFVVSYRKNIGTTTNPVMTTTASAMPIRATMVQSTIGCV